MKKTIFTLLITCITILSFAQSGINYQAVVRDAGGDILQNSNISVEFNVIEGSTAGPTVYTETHSATTNNFGNMVAIIGQGTPTLGTFNGIDWANGDHFLNVVIDGTDMGTTQFMSVPYALFTEKANQATMINEDNIKVNSTGTGEVIVGGGLSNARKLTVNDTKHNSETVDFVVDTLLYSGDILNLQVGNYSNDSAQFIEANKGFVTKFRVDVSGKVSRDATGLAKDLLPIAYGNVSSVGGLNTGSSNLSITKTSTGRYSITILGESFYFTDYIVVATPINGRTIKTGSSGGSLLIYTYDSSGNLVDGGFSFVVYKP